LTQQSVKNRVLPGTVSVLRLSGLGFAVRKGTPGRGTVSSELLDDDRPASHPG
jgi:hypothetical protein